MSARWTDVCGNGRATGTFTLSRSWLLTRAGGRREPGEHRHRQYQATRREGKRKKTQAVVETPQGGRVLGGPPAGNSTCPTPPSSLAAAWQAGKAGSGGTTARRPEHMRGASQTSRRPRRRAVSNSLVFPVVSLDGQGRGRRSCKPPFRKDAGRFQRIEISAGIATCERGE